MWFIESVVGGKWVRFPLPVSADVAFDQMKRYPDSTMLFFVCSDDLQAVAQ